MCAENHPAEHPARPDFRLNEAELQHRHPHGHPEFTVQEWRYQVQGGFTADGYWTWVSRELQSDTEALQGFLWSTLDHHLSHPEFLQKYAGHHEHPLYNLESWQENVKHGETLGYWWCCHQAMKRELPDGQHQDQLHLILQSNENT